MKKWEYKEITYQIKEAKYIPDIEERQVLGDEGWELVGIVPIIIGGTTLRFICHYKRELI